MKIAVAYIPVIHQGYLQFLDFAKEAGVEHIYLLGDELLETEDELDYLNRKDRLRAIPLVAMKQFVATYCGLSVEELTPALLEALPETVSKVLTLNDDVASIVVKPYFKDDTIEYSDIFVRWHKDNVDTDKEPEGEVVSLNEFQTKVFDDVLSEAAKSFDWWRQVAAALVKDDQVLYVAHNEHTPGKQLPNVLGDVRSIFKKGVNINYVTTTHAEIEVIATAAREGVSTIGASLYVTDFPCPYCARAIAKSGIKKLYFQKGYAVLDGDTFLKEAGVEVYKVTS